MKNGVLGSVSENQTLISHMTGRKTQSYRKTNYILIKGIPPDYCKIKLKLGLKLDPFYQQQLNLMVKRSTSCVQFGPEQCCVVI